MISFNRKSPLLVFVIIRIGCSDSTIIIYWDVSVCLYSLNVILLLLSIDSMQHHKFMSKHICMRIGYGFTWMKSNWFHAWFSSNKNDCGWNKIFRNSWFSWFRILRIFRFRWLDCLVDNLNMFPRSTPWLLIQSTFIIDTQPFALWCFDAVMITFYSELEFLILVIMN